MNSDAVNQFIASLGPAFQQSDPFSDSRPLERANLTTLVRIYGILAAGQYDALAEEMTEDVEMEIIGPAVIPFIGRWKGRADVCAATRRNFSFVKNQRPKIVNLTAQGNSIVVVAQEQGESVQTGTPYDIHWVQIFTFENAKMKKIHEVADGLDLAVAFTG